MTFTQRLERWAGLLLLRLFALTELKPPNPGEIRCTCPDCESHRHHFGRKS